MVRKIDAHQHFWDVERLSYPWLSPDIKVLYRKFLPADLAPDLAANGIESTITVQATHSEAETEWLLGLARENSFMKGVVGWLDITAPGLAEKLEALKSQGPLCGIRHQIHDEPDPRWVLQDKVINGLKTVVKADLVYDLLVRPVHLPYLPELFQAVPDARWVVDHIAKPEFMTRQIDDWFAGMKQVAQFPNVYCKVSGMITEADHANWTIEDIRPYFEKVLEVFGPERLLYGSDWPVCLQAGSYKQVVDLAAELTSSFSPSEQEAFWSGTAQKVYKIQ